MAIQQEISRELEEKKVGTVETGAIDREEGDDYIGRTQYDSPEVDCEVLIEKQTPLVIGQFYPVRITRAEEFDLYGEVQ